MLFGCREHLSVFWEKVVCRHLGHREKRHCLFSSLSNWSRGVSALSLRLLFLSTGFIISSFLAQAWLLMDAPALLPSITLHLVANRPILLFPNFRFLKGDQVCSVNFFELLQANYGIFFFFFFEEGRGLFLKKRSLWVGQILLEGCCIFSKMFRMWHPCSTVQDIIPLSVSSSIK